MTAVKLVHYLISIVPKHPVWQTALSRCRVPAVDTEGTARQQERRVHACSIAGCFVAIRPAIPSAKQDLDLDVELPFWDLSGSIGRHAAHPFIHWLLPTSSLLSSDLLEQTNNTGPIAVKLDEQQRNHLLERTSSASSWRRVDDFDELLFLQQNTWWSLWLQILQYSSGFRTWLWKEILPNSSKWNPTNPPNSANHLNAGCLHRGAFDSSLQGLTSTLSQNLWSCLEKFWHIPTNEDVPYNKLLLQGENETWLSRCTFTPADLFS